MILYKIGGGIVYFDVFCICICHVRADGSIHFLGWTCWKFHQLQPPSWTAKPKETLSKSYTLWPIYPPPKTKRFLVHFRFHEIRQAPGHQEAKEQRCSLWNCFYRRYAMDPHCACTPQADLSSQNTDIARLLLSPFKVWLYGFYWSVETRNPKGVK